ncbi:P-II family nitrogen regulator [Roseicella aerolata]|uniref:Nitrogen regulatory protein P-II n=1 Tax=Roseicella aerolata TaxID=2883479 RepID=A0A9X1II79_9PROT|nr:P-II family nitrogen regulator [Roseicella aerolata]MCB4825336.1 P-II family nitrogen regulator [Roseicella aerolata]
MRFKLLLVLVEDDRLDAVLKAAREAGATGATTLPSARGEGLKPKKTFFGLDLASQRDIVLLVVEEHLARGILEAIATAGRFDAEPGSGIAFQIAIEDAVGLEAQIRFLAKRVEDKL